MNISWLRHILTSEQRLTVLLTFFSVHIRTICQYHLQRGGRILLFKVTDKRLNNNAHVKSVTVTKGTFLVFCHQILIFFHDLSICGFDNFLKCCFFESLDTSKALSLHAMFNSSKICSKMPLWGWKCNSESIWQLAQINASLL